MGVEVKRLIRLITQLGLGGYFISGALPAMAGGFTQPKGLTFTSFSFFFRY